MVVELPRAQPGLNAFPLGLHTDKGEPSEGYSNDKFVASCIANPAYLHVRIYAEADYFMIEHLKDAVLAEFRVAIKRVIK